MHAYKQDRYITDCICVEVSLPSGETVWLDETMDTFQPALRLLEETLVGFPGPGWLLDVMMPPFAPNLTQLWPPVEGGERGA